MQPALRQGHRCAGPACHHGPQPATRCCIRGLSQRLLCLVAGGPVWPEMREWAVQVPSHPRAPDADSGWCVGDLAMAELCDFPYSRSWLTRDEHIEEKGRTAHCKGLLGPSRRGQVDLPSPAGFCSGIGPRDWSRGMARQKAHPGLCVRAVPEPPTQPLNLRLCGPGFLVQYCLDGADDVQ